jgi:hypothetical protein
MHSEAFVLFVRSERVFASGEKAYTRLGQLLDFSCEEKGTARQAKTQAS